MSIGIPNTHTILHKNTHTTTHTHACIHTHTHTNTHTTTHAHTRDRGSKDSSPNRVQSIYPILIHNNHVLLSLLIIYNNLRMYWEEEPWLFRTKLSFTQSRRPRDDDQHFITGISNISWVM